MKRKLFALLMLPLLGGGISASQAAVRVTGMKVLGLTSPLGIDQAPAFSWQTESDERGFLQQAYEITVRDAGGNTVWQTGAVASAQQTAIAYEGPALKSRTAYSWTLSVTGTDGQTAQAEAAFETAMMSPDEWTAQWIGQATDTVKARHTISFDEPFEARYLKIDVTRQGIPVSSEPNLYYVQLAEVEVWSGGENYDATQELTETELSVDAAGGWTPATVVAQPRFSCGQSSGPVGVLRSRAYEPVRVVEQWQAVSVTPTRVGASRPISSTSDATSPAPSPSA